MKLMELIKAVKMTDKDAFAKVNDKEAAAIVKSAFSAITRQINETTEDSIKIGGLGTFVVKPVEREVKGNEVTVKRIVFRPSKK